MLIRTDILLADQIVQVGHVCVEAGNQFSQPAGPSHLVLLGIASQDRLLEAAAKIDLAGYPYAIFFEPDDDLGFSAICTGPLAGQSRRLFKQYSLWNEPNEVFTERERAPPTTSV